MRAIVNVNKNSAYAQYNGLTFEVLNVNLALIDLSIEGRTVGFSFTEIFICDFQQEIQKEYEKHNWGSNNHYNNLKKYAEKKNIEYKTDFVTYA